MIELKGRRVTKSVDNGKGFSLLDLALKHEVDWGFSCTKGTCARCRCLITEGADKLEPPTESEESRLEPEELEAGYRLACQVVVKADGPIAVIHKPYF